MASFAQIGKALKDRRSAKSLASLVIRHGSGSRARDVNSVVKTVRSDVIGCPSGAGTSVPLTSSSSHVRFLPVGNSARHVDTSSVVAAKQMTELATAPTTNTAANINNATATATPSVEKVGEGPLYGRRRKRSSETIRHDKLYLQSSDVSKREYAQTWNDFQDKRSIPSTEWGKRLSSDD